MKITAAMYLDDSENEIFPAGQTLQQDLIFIDFQQKWSVVKIKSCCNVCPAGIFCFSLSSRYIAAVIFSGFLKKWLLAGQGAERDREKIESSFPP